MRTLGLSVLVSLAISSGGCEAVVGDYRLDATLPSKGAPCSENEDCAAGEGCDSGGHCATVCTSDNTDEVCGEFRECFSGLCSPPEGSPCEILEYNCGYNQCENLLSDQHTEVDYYCTPSCSYSDGRCPTGYTCVNSGCLRDVE